MFLISIIITKNDNFQLCVSFPPPPRLLSWIAKWQQDLGVLELRNRGGR